MDMAMKGGAATIRLIQHRIIARPNACPHANARFTQNNYPHASQGKKTTERKTLSLETPLSLQGCHSTASIT